MSGRGSVVVWRTAAAQAASEGRAAPGGRVANRVPGTTDGGTVVVVVGAFVGVVVPGALGVVVVTGALVVVGVTGALVVVVGRVVVVVAQRFAPAAAGVMV